MKTKLSGKFWLALTVFGLIGQVAWVVENMYLNVFIYKMFHASASDISAMVAASAVAATLTTVLIGALSDKVGKRKLFICGGYILWGISIFAFTLLKVDTIEKIFPMTASAAALGASLTIILDCVMTFFGSSANDAAFNAWVTDSTDSTNRGGAEGINSMMPLVAILAVFGGFMFFDLDLAESWTLIFVIIGAVVTLVGILGIFIIEDSPVSPSEGGYLSGIVYGFLPSTVKKNTELYVTLLSFIVFNISIQIFMPYLIIYYEVSLGMSDYVFVMAPAIVLASVVTAFWGKIYDKKGFALSSAVSLLWLFVGYVILFFVRAKVPVFIGSLFMMCGYLSSMAVFGAKIRDLTPVGKAGRFQGVRIFSQVFIPGVVGPWIGKTVLKNADIIVNSDGTSSFVPNANIFAAALAAGVAASVVLIITAKRKKPHLCELTTPFETESETNWESEHPSPQMRRETWQSLSGEWELSVKKDGKVTPVGKIKVPFPPESRISGIKRTLRRGEKYVYTCTFSLADDFLGKRTLLHFGAVDQHAEVEINGRRVTEHRGGYLPFECDITDSLCSGENTVKVTVTDGLDRNYPYGKQRRKRGGMWYTPVSGIWQTVWLEAVPENRIERLKLTPTCDSVKIEVTGGEIMKNISLETGEAYTFEGDSFVLKLDSPEVWTPDSPKLYYFTLTSGNDRVESYFALRDVGVGNVNGKPYILLNGKPVFFHGLLDQGYFSDGIYTPASPDGYLYDVKTAKSLGFNMLRKHIKIEPELYYYYCDKYGIAVFQDLVNSGGYSFILDTALPTVGIKRGLSRKASKKRRDIFTEAAKETLDRLYNHPCIFCYTIFNEGWGQHDADLYYDLLKKQDPTRIYDTASGWFIAKKTDVVSDHVYFKKIATSPEAGKPMTVSEFGGYSCKLDSHAFNLDNTYGYRYFDSTDKLTNALEALYRDEVIPKMSEGLCATVLTQLTDVEDETNGLITYDRRVIKTDPERMKKLSDDMRAAFDTSLCEK